MAVTRAQQTRLGIFIAVGLVLLGAGLVVLAGMKLGERRDLYPVRFSEANISLSGLDVGSPVKYSGIRIGRVESIRVDPQDVSVIEVTLSLDGGTPVAEDSVASLGSQGITGLKYIELSRGKRTARIRKPGEEIPAGASLLDELTDQASAIAAKINTLTDRLNTFTTPDMRDRVANLLDKTNKLIDTTEATVAENRGNLQDLSQRLSETSAQVETLTVTLNRTASRLDGFLAASQPDLQRLVSETTALMAELRQSRTQLDGALQESQLALRTARQTMGPEGLGRSVESADKLMTRGYLLLLQSQEELGKSLAHLRQTAENMSAFSMRIRDDPSLLILGGAELGDEP